MKTILFVCTGNTCRSPMAACMLNDMLAREGRDDIRAISAGIAAVEGQPASPGAQHAMAKRGLSLAEHRSTAVTKEMLDSTYCVFAITHEHARVLSRRFDKKRNIFTFDPPIPDPYGGSDAEYEACADAMEPTLRMLASVLCYTED